MKKSISLILAVIFALSTFAICGMAADEPLTGVYAIQDDLLADDGVDRKINLYEHNGTYYLFVPASVKLALADFVVSTWDPKMKWMWGEALLGYALDEVV